MEEKLLELVSTRRGHFVLESGHHAVESVARLANELWEPAACPLCAAGVPLSSPPA
jgi:hypothetical protein